MPMNLKVILQIITMTKIYILATQLSWMFNLNLSLSEVNLHDAIIIRTAILRSYYSTYIQYLDPSPTGNNEGLEIYNCV